MHPGKRKKKARPHQIYLDGNIVFPWTEFMGTYQLDHDKSRQLETTVYTGVELVGHQTSANGFTCVLDAELPIVMVYDAKESQWQVKSWAKASNPECDAYYLYAEGDEDDHVPWGPVVTSYGSDYLEWEEEPGHGCFAEPGAGFVGLTWHRFYWSEDASFFVEDLCITCNEVGEPAATPPNLTAVAHQHVSLTRPPASIDDHRQFGGCPVHVYHPAFGVYELCGTHNLRPIYQLVRAVMGDDHSAWSPGVLEAKVEMWYSESGAWSIGTPDMRNGMDGRAWITSSSACSGISPVESVAWEFFNADEQRFNKDEQATCVSGGWRTDIHAGFPHIFQRQAQALILSITSANSSRPWEPELLDEVITQMATRPLRQAPA